MLFDKVQRASTIIPQILQLIETHGQPVPARADGRKMAQFVDVDPRWTARVEHGLRIIFGPIYETEGSAPSVTIGQRWVADRSCKVVELFAGRRDVLIVNLLGDQIELFRFRPGTWESWFGVDNGGDEVVFDKVFFPRPGSPELKELLASPDAQIPALRKGPRTDADASAAARQHSGRQRWPGQLAQPFPRHLCVTLAGYDAVAK